MRLKTRNVTLLKMCGSDTANAIDKHTRVERITESLENSQETSIVLVGRVVARCRYKCCSGGCCGANGVGCGRFDKRAVRLE